MTSHIGHNELAAISDDVTTLARDSVRSGKASADALDACIKRIADAGQLDAAHLEYKGVMASAARKALGEEYEALGYASGAKAGLMAFKLAWDRAVSLGLVKARPAAEKAAAERASAANADEPESPDAAPVQTGAHSNRDIAALILAHFEACGVTRGAINDATAGAAELIAMPDHAIADLSQPIYDLFKGIADALEKCRAGTLLDMRSEGNAPAATSEAPAKEKGKRPAKKQAAKPASKAPKGKAGKGAPSRSKAKPASVVDTAGMI